MKEQDNRLLVFLWMLGVSSAGALIYGLLIFWPYLVFYVLPFVVGSVAIGVMLNHGASNKLGFKTYRNIGMIFPALLLGILLTFFYDSERGMQSPAGYKVMDAEWPRADALFNAARRAGYANAPFASWQANARSHVTYDRQEIGFIFLWCLIVGGPLCFAVLSLSSEKEEREMFYAHVESSNKGLDREQTDRYAALNAKFKENEKLHASQITSLKQALAAATVELEAARAKLEFSGPVKKVKPPPGGGGILDSDIL